MTELETQVLQNGLIIEDISIELRIEQICINALKWGLKTYDTTDYKVRREMCLRIMNSFPKEILLNGFVMGHIGSF